MTQSNRYLSCLIFLVFTLLLAGCSAKKTDFIEEMYDLKKIIVLPTDKITVAKEEINGTAQALEEGSRVIDEIIAEYLGNKQGVLFISAEQQDTLLTEYNQSRSAQAIGLGKQLQGDAVLTTRINRYQERSGQDYSIDNPASISFEYRLMLVDNGQTLCAGVFDETQKSLTENLLLFQKAVKRGGKWITARDLAKEGVETKFDTCRFLKK